MSLGIKISMFLRIIIIIGLICRQTSLQRNITCQEVSVIEKALGIKISMFLRIIIIIGLICMANLSSTEYNMPGSVRNTKGFTTRQKCVCIREASVLETVRVVRRDIFFGEILCLHMFQSCLY